MIFFAIIVVLATILTALVAGNNMSAAVGTLIGSRILSRTGGVIIGMLGFIAGLLIQGHNLSSTAVRLIPRENTIIAYSLGIALGIFLLAAYLRVPLSLTMALVGISIGISERNGFALDKGLISIIIFTWVLAPVLSILSAYLLNKKLSGLRPGNVWNFALSLKLALIAVSFLTAFTLGANTLGFIEQVADIHGYYVLLLILGIAFGSFFLSSGVIKRVGQEMYMMRYTNAFVSLVVSSVLVEAATIIGLPLSNTQTLTSSVFGTGLSYKSRAMASKPFLITVGTWVVSPLLGILFGLIL